ncbi:transposase [Microbacterium xylanilyticum]
MPALKKYDEETQARAVRMYLDRVEEGDVSLRAARAEVGELLGINESTLRNWVRREVGEGTTSAGSERPDDEVVQLRREVARLRRANEILKTASAFFAAAELDRKLGQ